MATNNFIGTSTYNYIVAPFGNFHTIQAAIDAVVADAATPATIYIYPGTYTENLVLADGVNLLGSNEMEVFVVGEHTPPASGDVSFDSIKFISATDVLLDAGANTCNIKFYNCVFDLTASGYVFNMDLATGILVIESCTEWTASVDNGIVYNTAGAVLDVIDSTIGVGVTGSTISGVTRIFNSSIFCPLAFTLTSAALIDSSTINDAITVANDATLNVYNSYLIESAASCITTTSTNPVTLANVVLDTPIAGSAIDGTGTIECGSVTFIQTDAIAGTLTVTHNANLKASNLTTHGLVTLPATNAAGTEGIIDLGADHHIHAIGTRNTFMGAEAGNLALTVVSATDSTGVGFEALHDLTAGDNNCAYGSYSSTLVTTGQYNSSFGASSLATTTGDYNIAVGYDAASALVLAESSNIIIGSPGVVGDNNTIRIGVDGAGAGQQDSNYQAGIYQATSGATKEVVWIDSTFKLSSSNIGIVSWVTATASMGAANNTGYIIKIAVPGLLTLTLPAVAVVGDIIEVAGYTVGGWSIAQNALQQIHYGNLDSTLGALGSLSSTARYDTVKLLCTTANTDWVVLSSIGILNVV